MIISVMFVGGMADYKVPSPPRVEERVRVRRWRRYEDSLLLIELINFISIHEG